VARDFAASPLSARERFASQVRHLRAQKGFATARSFARALDIEENRYTRYERAEVEPSLTLIADKMLRKGGTVRLASGYMPYECAQSESRSSAEVTRHEQHHLSRRSHCRCDAHSERARAALAEEG